MINKIKTMLTICLLVFASSNAQDFNCRTKEQNDVIFKKNPRALKEWNEFNNFSKSQEAARIRELKNPSSYKAATYTVPVVFHVYGNIQSGKTVTYEKLVAVLNEVNKDFNGLNDDFNSVEPFFQARRATLNIEFKLAKIDPNGNCTNGVVFYPEKSGYGNGGGYDSQIAADAWDNKKYLNVYIQNDLYNDGSVTNSGVAWYPDSGMTAANTARIVFNGAYIFGNTDKEFAATMTHEFGHFFNLIHTFEGGCSDGDQVTDTPAEDGLHSLSCTPGTNCSGQKVNIENYLGYNGARGCYKMFTQGQVARMLTALQHPARITLWQPANLTATGVNTSGVALSITNSLFKENNSNDGSLAGNAIIALDGSKTFSLTSGTLTRDVHYTISNLPSGLTPVVTVNNNKQLSLTFSGNATNHASNNSGTISINLLSAAFTGGASDVRCTGLTIKTKFVDPYGIFFVNMPDVSVRGANNSWMFFRTDIVGDNTEFGAWRYAANHLKFETYGKRLVCQSGTRNISLLTSGTAIGTSSNFTAPGIYPDQLDLRTASYRNWDGQTGFVGFEYEIDGEKCYGWFKVIVDANGDGYTVTEYAYNTQPGGTIIAGNTTNPTTINAPSTLLATVNTANTAVTLNWKDNSNNETGFTIERSINNGTYSTLTTLGANIVTFTDNNVTSGTNYSYRVRAFNSSSNSTYSNIATATITSTTLVSAPTNLTATANTGSTSVALNWVDNATNETGYTVERSNDNGTTFTNLATLGANVTTYNDTTVSTGNTFSYRVRAFNTTVNSAFSNVATVTLTNTTTVNTPTNLTATANTASTAVTLNWVDNATNETGYIVQRATNNGTYTTVGTLAANIRTYNDNTVTTGNSYSYRVRAFNGTVNSTFSNVATVTLSSNTTLATPTRVAANGIYSDGFYITWDLVSSATSYDIQLWMNGAWTIVGSSSTYYFWVDKQGSTLTYTFRVRAKNATSVSNWSTQSTTTIPAAGPQSSENTYITKAFKFSPNPTEDMIYIENYSKANFSVEIYNASGILIEKFDNQLNYSTKNLKSGLYLLKYRSGNIVETQKLIKK